MSFILNALRKSEEERQSVQSDPLQDRIQERQYETKKKKSLWLIIFSLVNLCLFLYFIWFFMLKNEPDTSKEKLHYSVDKSKEIIEAEKIPQPLKVATTKKIVKPEAVIKETIGIDEARVEARKQEPQVSIAQRLANQRLVNIQKKEAASQSKISDNQQFIKKENSPFAKRAYKPIKTEDRFEELGQRRNNPPYLSGLSYEFRRRVPKVQINVFVYSEKEEDRMIMIEMRRYQVGEDIAENMELKEIRKNSIVVEYKDEVFQIKR